jgi:arginine repressor
MSSRRKGYAEALVQVSTGRVVADLLRELYVDKRHSQEEIAEALNAQLVAKDVDDVEISRATVSSWLSKYGITRDDRPAVAL